ncbi:MAG: two-component regulator propeller domain-containing protein [Calditrichia bacterium]
MAYSPTLKTRFIIRWMIGLLLLATTGLLPQEYRFEHLTNTDGLSENSVVTIYQDKQGYLWFGTIGGLNRYDGYQFKVFKASQKDTLSIGSNYITTIIEDRDGDLWIGSWQGGLNRFDRDNENFRCYGNGAGQIPGLSDNSAVSIYHDSQDRFWVGTVKGGLNLFDRKTGEATAFQYSVEDTTSIGGNIINAILEDAHGNLWLGVSGKRDATNVHGLNLLKELIAIADDSTRAVFIRYENDITDPGTMPNSSISAILQDPKDANALWISTRQAGIAKFNTTTREFVQLRHSPNKANSLSSDKIYSIFLDSRQRLWAATFGGGLNLKLPQTNSFVSYRNSSANPFSINDDKVISLAEDRTGNLWIGTHKAGLNKLNFQANRFKHYNSGVGGKIRLSSNFISSIFEDKNGTLWVGTQNGLNRIDRNRENVKAYLHDPKDPTSLSHNWVYAILEDSQDNFWVGTYGGGLNLFDRQKGTFKKFQYDPQTPAGLNDNDVLSLNEYNGYIWVGSRGGGLSRFNLVDKTFKHYVPDEADSASIGDGIVRKIHIDNAGIFWLATSGGLSSFNPISERFTQFTHHPDDSNSISDNLTISINETSKNSIWVGTLNGLNRFDKKTKKFHRYYQEDGLPNDVVQASLVDERGQLWISTNHGISLFNSGKTETFRNFELQDGLPGNEFNQNTAFIGGDGIFYFGGPAGLCYFHPDSLSDSSYEPPVVITDFLLFNRSVAVSSNSKPTPLKKAISQLDELSLSYQHKVFSFEFAGLDYTSPSQNQYAYKMEGFDDTWIPAGKRRFATYTNLDPGEYIFRVRTSNNARSWSDNGKSLKITIEPPYWETWWFRLIVVLTAVVIPLLIYRNRVMNLLALERLRVRIASDLHDDIGGTLNAIVMQSELLKSGLQADKIPERVDKIGIMGREATRMLSDVVWSIDSRNDTLGDLVDHIKDFVDLMFSKQNIELSYQIEGLNLQKSVDINLRQNLYLISKEAISNIAKYAEANKVNISLVNSSESFTMCISDNGIGDGNSTRRSGHGLRNMNLRAERLSGKITFRNKDGFTVIFEGPSI